jgi:glycosyltransferase involved in cell wall biosynthesis
MAEIKVHIVPWYKRPDKGDGGIRRVVEAQFRHLQKFGITTVGDADAADVLACHGTALVTRPGKPTVNHNHGLYWAKYDWPAWAHDANRQVVQAMAASVAHTAPSHWVSNAIRRGMLAYPEVVYHGVDADDWNVSPEPQPYVLWNKARTDYVSDPADMNTVAKLLPNRWFVSTFGEQGVPNIKTVGKIPFDEMKGLIENAGVYLATARETFGIGTLEAMAAGVPVAGWAWGGQVEIIKHGETGYLAPPGDFDALAECIELCFRDQERLSINCQQDIRDRWTWEPRIQQYADIYKRVHEGWYEERPRISVIVTCYNLDRFLGDCLRSIAANDDHTEDYEVLVIDDCSPDNTKKIADLYMEQDARIRYIKTPENLGLSGARNFGFSHARGRYIINVDADDMLTHNALPILADALDNNPGLHIAYGHLDITDEERKERRRNSWPSKHFDWWGQMAHMNQPIYASMMRREVMERSGGYRVRDWRAEDASFWCRVTSFGFRAGKVTEEPTLLYRDRHDSKSKGEPGDGPWTEWYPWNMAVKFDRKNLHKVRNHLHDKPELVPFGAQGRPANGIKFWMPEDHADPVISVIIPVGPGHESYVIDALDSLVAQTYPYWEAIVVNDTGQPWSSDFGSPIAGAPYAKVVETTGRVGPSAARNRGAEHARGEALLFVDADDFMRPEALYKMAEIYFGTEGGLVYTDIYELFADPTEEMKVYNNYDFKCGAVLKKMQHSSQYLFPRAKHEEIGGFDENIIGWEDWDHLIALQAAGVCSYRIPEPLFVYRKHTGNVREAAWENRRPITDYIKKKWLPYYEGRIAMPCAGCPGSRKSRPPSQRVSSFNVASQSTVAPGTEAVMLIYDGPGAKRVSVRGPATGTAYRFKRGTPHYVDAADAEILLQRVRRDGKPDFTKYVETKMPVPEKPPSPDGPKQPMQRPRLPMPEMTDTVVEFDAKIALERSIPQMTKAIGADAFTLDEIQAMMYHEVGNKNRKGMVALLADALEVPLEEA